MPVSRAKHNTKLTTKAYLGETRQPVDEHRSLHVAHRQTSPIVPDRQRRRRVRRRQRNLHRFHVVQQPPPLPRSAVLPQRVPPLGDVGAAARPALDREDRVRLVRGEAAGAAHDHRSLGRGRGGREAGSGRQEGCL